MCYYFQPGEKGKNIYLLHQFWYTYELLNSLYWKSWHKDVNKENVELHDHQRVLLWKAYNNVIQMRYALPQIFLSLIRNFSSHFFQLHAVFLHGLFFTGRWNASRLILKMNNLEYMFIFISLRSESIPNGRYVNGGNE